MSALCFQSTMLVILSRLSGTHDLVIAFNKIAFSYQLYQNNFKKRQRKTKEIALSLKICFQRHALIDYGINKVQKSQDPYDIASSILLLY